MSRLTVQAASLMLKSTRLQVENNKRRDKEPAIAGRRRFLFKLPKFPGQRSCLTKVQAEPTAIEGPDMAMAIASQLSEYIPKSGRPPA